VQFVTEFCDRSLQKLQSGQVDQMPLGKIDQFLGTPFVKLGTAPDPDLHRLGQFLSQLKSELGEIEAALKERNNLSMLCKSLPPD